MTTKVMLKKSRAGPGHKRSLKIKVTSMPCDTGFLGHFAHIDIDSEVHVNL